MVNLIEYLMRRKKRMKINISTSIILENKYTTKQFFPNTLKHIFKQMSLMTSLPSDF